MSNQVKILIASVFIGIAIFVAFGIQALKCTPPCI